MRRSSLRLIISSVLAGWAIGGVVLTLYVQSREWTEDKVRRSGVFLAYELLEQTPEIRREKRLQELREHMPVELALISLDELSRRIGRPGQPGEGISQRQSITQSWYFIVFEDGSGALAAGPVNPTRPPGVIPVGLLLVIVLLPVIAWTVALRLGRETLKVERANQALAIGDLSIRVDDKTGPSDALAASFNAMAERVERLVNSRDELVQAVSHELGSPLSRLRFHVGLLENLSEAKRMERIQSMVEELDNLDALVAELLSYVQSDDLALDKRSFNPTESLEHVVELVRHEVPENSIVDVQLKLPSDVRVYADKRLFLRATENILRNAVQHAVSTVYLEITKDAEHLHLAVHDDGPGIPQASRENVVTPFFRLQADRGRQTGGVGLGLPIVRRILQRHGGRLVITDSALGGAKVATLWPTANG